MPRRLCMVFGLIPSTLTRTHQDIAQLCQQERESGNQTSYCLEYLLASTEYDAFVQMMCDFYGVKGFEVDGDDFAGLDCLGFGALEGLIEGPSPLSRAVCFDTADSPPVLGLARSCVRALSLPPSLPPSLPVPLPLCRVVVCMCACKYFFRAYAELRVCVSVAGMQECGGHA